MTGELRICKMCPENGPQPLAAFPAKKKGRDGKVYHRHVCRICYAVQQALYDRTRAKPKPEPEPEREPVVVSEALPGGGAPIGSLPPGHVLAPIDAAILRARLDAGMVDGRRRSRATHGFRQSSLADA